MKKLLVATMFGVVLITSGCATSRPSPGSAIVVDKNIDPGHCEKTRRSKCVKYDDIDYILYLENGEVVDVPKELYDKVNIGDVYDGEY